MLKRNREPQKAPGTSNHRQCDQQERASAACADWISKVIAVWDRRLRAVSILPRGVLAFELRARPHFRRIDTSSFGPLPCHPVSPHRLAKSIKFV
jgi:hypothetical protein